MTNDSSHFDYIIIGNGLAGLQLALELASDSYFKNKEIALLDPSTKSNNDKTWSFWEKNSSKWTSIIHKSWKEASIITSQKKIDLNLQPYSYKTIRAIDFYNEIKLKLKEHNNFHFIIDSAKTVIEGELVNVITDKHMYTASHVFDSRIPEEFSILSKNHILITQHFKGWVIKTKDEIFDDTKVTMMDYRLKDGKQTTFTYVLPFSKNEALIEFTYFNEHLVQDSVYDDFLKQYINNFLRVTDYTIIEIEKGKIPMTNFPFEKYNTNKVTKIGTGGGWVKGATGYSYKNTEKKITQIINNIKTNKPPSNKLFKRKYKFYDKVFLKVLKDENHKVEWIFQQFYGKNSIRTMFRFLDEDSNILEDIKIMWSLFSWSFIKAFFKTL